MSPLSRPAAVAHAIRTALPNRRRLPLAIAQAMLLWTALPTAPIAGAGVLEVNGAFWIDPPSTLSPRPGVDYLPGVRLWLGVDTYTGVMTMGEGQSLTLAGLYVGAAQGFGGATIDGPGTRLRLVGGTGRLNVGDFGFGRLTLSGGASIDARFPADTNCLGADAWCGAVIGSAAGSTGIMTLTGSGTSASFASGLSVGTAHLDPGYGIPGGTTRATLNVLDGATLYSDNAYIADNFTSPLSNGHEVIYSDVTLDGAGSSWRVGGDLTLDRAAFNAGSNVNGNAHVTVGNGARVVVGAARLDHGVSLGRAGGVAEMHVHGAGSALEIAPGGYLNVGDGGRATLSIEDAASLAGGADVWIGRNGGSGTLVITGPGTSALFDDGARLHLGSNGGGELAIRDGAKLSVGNIWAGENGGGAGILVSGAGSRLDSTFPAGPGNDIQLGMGGFGQLTVADGGTVTARGISLGNQAVGGGRGGNGYVTVIGAGSRITLDATDWHRLGLEIGTLTVSAGGLFDAGAGLAACAHTWCGAFIGANAGADANVVVVGAGSRAVFASDFRVGAAYATKPPATPYTIGIPGAATRASVSVRDGGRLETSSVLAGLGSGGNAALGTERIDVTLDISGQGSIWAVTGIPGATSAAAFRTGVGFNGYNAANVNVDLRIAQGGTLRLGQAGQTFSDLALGDNAGRTTALVSGAGSTVELLADYNQLSVGHKDAYGSLSFTDGARLSGASQVLIGADGGWGRLSFDAANASLGNGSFVGVGYGGGNGQLNLTHGALFDYGGNSQTSSLLVGYGARNASGTQGAVLIDSGATLRMTSRATDELNPDGDYNYNPYAVIGYNGNGALTIGGGGALVMRGLLADTPDRFRVTSLLVGFNNSLHAAGSVGTAYVGGAGSLLEVSGADASISVGASAGAIGQMAVQDHADVRTTLLEVGVNGGSGSLNVDRASVALSGQFALGPATAGLVVGLGNGAFGTANLTRGASVDIRNAGAAGAGLSIGGAGGTGIVNASGGSRIVVAAAPGLAYATLGDGAGSVGVMNLNHADLDVGDGKVLLAGAAGGQATLTLSNQATLRAGYVGVGSTAQGDGGQARLIVNDSTLTADLLEVGSQGYVGGNGVLRAAIVNRGTISPGNSPGTLTLGGGFLNQGGGKLLLEIAADGSGGYMTDHLLFMAGSALDMRGLQVTFRFLGDADPNGFLASGAFDIDRFIGWQDGGALAHGLYGGVSYAAVSDAYRFDHFLFTADGGASFTAAAVPEPATWLTMLAGLAAVGTLARRRRLG